LALPRKKGSVRGSFTLLEVLFSIVVVGIAIMAMPLILRTSSSLTPEILKIEAVNQVYIFNKNIDTYFWDHSSTDDQNISFFLDTVGVDDDEFDRYPDPSSLYRRGRFNNERRFFDVKTDPTDESALGPESGEDSEDKYNDIDDFNGFGYTISKSVGDYLIDMTLKARVFYIDDSADYTKEEIFLPISSTKSSKRYTNIKMVEVSAYDEEGNLVVRMYSWAQNIGSYRAARRDF